MLLLLLVVASIESAKSFPCCNFRREDGLDAPPGSDVVTSASFDPLGRLKLPRGLPLGLLSNNAHSSSGNGEAEKDPLVESDDFLSAVLGVPAGEPGGVPSTASATSKASESDMERRRMASGHSTAMAGRFRRLLGELVTLYPTGGKGGALRPADDVSNSKESMLRSTDPSAVFAPIFSSLAVADGKGLPLFVSHSAESL